MNEATNAFIQAFILLGILFAGILGAKWWMEREVYDVDSTSPDAADGSSELASEPGERAGIEDGETRQGP